LRKARERCLRRERRRSGEERKVFEGFGEVSVFLSEGRSHIFERYGGEVFTSVKEKKEYYVSSLPEHYVPSEHEWYNTYCGTGVVDSLKAADTAWDWITLVALATGGRPQEWNPISEWKFKDYLSLMWFFGFGEKFLKQLRANMASALTRQPFVEPKENIPVYFPFVAGASCWWKSLLRRSLPRRLSDAQTILSSKGLFPEVSREFISDSLRDTVAALTRDPCVDLEKRQMSFVDEFPNASHHFAEEELVGDPVTGFSPSSVMIALKNAVIRTTREVYRESLSRTVPGPDGLVTRWDPASGRTTRLPCVSGRFKKSRVRKGGEVSPEVEVVNQRKIVRTRCPCCDLNLDYRSYIQSCLSPVSVLYKGITGHGIQYVDEATWSLRDQDLAAFMTSEHICQGDRTEVYSYLEPGRPDGLPDPGEGHAPFRVELVALPEPVKVRVISKGENELYHWLPGFQGDFWRLTRHPCFRLVGSPITEEIPFINSHIGLRGEGEEYLSIDYSAATDKIHPFLSEVCVKELCTLFQYSDTDTHLICESLLHGRILTGDGYVRQTWGQLMGHPLSFPILCIINAAVIRFAYEFAERVVRKKPNFRVRLHKLPLLVNGDDAVLKAPDYFYAVWSSITPHAGLHPSVGKNWRSREFFTINSMMFSLAEVPYFQDGILMNLLPVPFVNLSALKRTPFSDRALRKITEGIRPLGGSSYTGCRLPFSLLDLSSRSHALIEFVDLPADRSQLIKLFLRRNRHILASPEVANLSVSWHAGIECGGIGIPDPATELHGFGHYSISAFQRAFHCYLGSGSQEDIFYSSDDHEFLSSVTRDGTLMVSPPQGSQSETISVSIERRGGGHVLRDTPSYELVPQRVLPCGTNPDRIITTPGEFTDRLSEESFAPSLKRYREVISRRLSSFYAMLRRSGLSTEQFCSRILGQFCVDDHVLPAVRQVDLTINEPCSVRHILQTPLIDYSKLTYLTPFTY
jgi:hypothetical protein